MATAIRPLADKASDIASFLDECWGNWRNGAPTETYIIYTDAQNSCFIIEKDDRPGFLLVDGKPFYSQAWL